MKVIREWIRNEANYEACNVSDAFTDKKNGKVSKLAKHGDDIESWGQHESTHFTKASMRNGATKPANQRTRKMTQRGCLAALQVANSVVVCDDDGKVLVECSSQRECAAYFGVNPSTVSYCISGKTKHVRGYRILPRRPDNIYPPADHSSTSEDIAAATSKPCDSSNALEVIRKHRRSRTASLGKRKSVVLLDESGKVLKTFSSQHEASLELGLTPSEVSNAVRGCRLMKLGRNRLHIELAPGNVYPAAAQTHAELIPQISSKGNVEGRNIRRETVCDAEDSKLPDGNAYLEAGNQAEIIEIVDGDVTELESEVEESGSERDKSDKTLIDTDDDDDDDDEDWLDDIIATVTSDTTEHTYHDSSNELMLQHNLSQAGPHLPQDIHPTSNTTNQGSGFNVVSSSSSSARGSFGRSSRNRYDFGETHDSGSVAVQKSSGEPCQDGRGGVCNKGDNNSEQQRRRLEKKGLRKRQSRKKRKRDETAYTEYLTEARLRMRRLREKRKAYESANAESLLTSERLGKRKAYWEHQRPRQEAEHVEHIEERHPQQACIRPDPHRTDYLDTGSSKLETVDCDAGRMPGPPPKVNRRFWI